VNEEMADEEWFEHELFYFLKALRVLEMNAEDQCDAMGNFNVAFEMQLDVSGPAVAMAASPISYFTEAQAAELLRLADALKKLPEEALFPKGLNVRSHEGSITAMSHPSWAPLRVQARDLLKVLEPAIQRNVAYFQ
jgi:hypothetical protein